MVDTTNGSKGNPRTGAPSCDVVNRNGLFLDGLGHAGRRVDLAMDAGRVKEVGPGLAVVGRREIDAAGCWVLPGLLDIHTHFDRPAGEEKGIPPQYSSGDITSRFPSQTNEILSGDSDSWLR